MKDPMQHSVTPSSQGAIQTGADGGTRRIQLGIVSIALLLLAVGTGNLTQDYGWRHGVLFLVGAGFGIVLYHARFGFTSAFRALVASADGSGLRAQMLMLALATLLFAPILALSTAVGGAVAPLSASVLIGAFIFGIGMQLGGG